MPGTDAYRLAVMASGAGSTFRSLVAAERSGRLHAHVDVLIVSRAGTEAATAGQALGITTKIVDERLIGAAPADARHLQILTGHAVDLVVLAGYLRLIGPLTLGAYRNRVINTHPAPLPRFGGPGMYGRRVHEAVLAAGVGHSAATVHLVDAEYDHGDVLATTPVPVQSGDDVDALRARVQIAERTLLVETINTLARAHR